MRSILSKFQGLPCISEYHEIYLVILNSKDYLVFLNTTGPTWYFWIPLDLPGIYEYHEIYLIISNSKDYLVFLNTKRPTWYFWIPWDLSCNIKFQGLPGISEYHETYLVFLNTKRPNFQGYSTLYTSLYWPCTCMYLQLVAPGGHC